MNKSEEIESKILKYFKEKPIDGIYIFGSLARNELKDSSDIDIAILGNIDISDRLDYTLELGEILEKNVDIIDFYKADLNFQAEIIISGRSLFFRDKNIKDSLEMNTLSKYLMFEEDRKIIIDAIYDRGSVYKDGKSNIK